MLTEQFLLGERVPCLAGDDVDRTLLQLTLDGSEQREERLPDVVLQSGEARGGGGMKRDRNISISD